MLRRNLLALPMHAGRFAVVNLHAIHADVPLSRLWISRDHAGQRDKPPGIFRPALQDGKIEQRKIVALDDFLAWSGRNCLWKKFAHLSEHGQHLYLVEKTLGRLNVHESADTVCNFVK